MGGVGAMSTLEEHHLGDPEARNRLSRRPGAEPCPEMCQDPHLPQMIEDADQWQIKILICCGRKPSCVLCHLLLGVHASVSRES